MSDSLLLRKIKIITTACNGLNGCDRDKGGGGTGGSCDSSSWFSGDGGGVCTSHAADMTNLEIPGNPLRAGDCHADTGTGFDSPQGK